MPQTQPYDVLIVGAGPAGLSAARTVARLGFRTVVVERQARAGNLGRLPGAAVLPAPETVGRPGSGLAYPHLDLRIPESLVLDHEAALQCLSPSGAPFAAMCSAGTIPGVIVERAGLLRLMVQHARCAGAQVLFDVEVNGLLLDAGRVTGVATSAGTLHAETVICAEGAGRLLCDQAGLYGGQPQRKRHAFMMVQEYEGPALRAEHVGRIITLGKRYTSAYEGWGSLLVPVPGRAELCFTVLVEELNSATLDWAWRYAQEYAGDPRVSRLLARARPTRRMPLVIEMRRVPERLAVDGFVGVGDAITPAGHLGVLPAMHLGRQAALAVAQTLDGGPSAEQGLADYAQMVRASVLHPLAVEFSAMLGVLRLADEDLETLREALSRLGLPLPLLGWGQLMPRVALTRLLALAELPPAQRRLVEQAYGAGPAAKLGGIEQLAPRSPYRVATRVTYGMPGA